MPCEPLPPGLTTCVYWYEELYKMQFFSLDFSFVVLSIVFIVGIIIFLYKRLIKHP